MNDHPTPLGGPCSARFDPVRELFAPKLESGEDLGASVALNIDGEMVVDLWGGWADEARTVPWTENTIANVFSATKTMTALTALVLVDRGQLDLDTTVASNWPEFAARGKEGIEIRHLLSHTSGVSGWEQPVTLEDVYDWDKSTAHSFSCRRTSWRSSRGRVRMGQIDRPVGRPGALVGTRDSLGLPNDATW
jgi:CubicO group peptidase (beta-lactamase class C family)